MADFDDSSDGEAPLLVAAPVPTDAAAPAARAAIGRVGPGGAPPDAAARAVPVTILCGFLGAGKTTLLGRLLDGAGGLKIAVVENELGDTRGLEARVAAGAVSESLGGRADVVELANGCVCCSVKDELVQTLEALVVAKPHLDALVVELSGVANPGPVAAAFWLDAALEARVALDAVVCVVDCVNGLETLGAESGGFEAKRQITYADRILLNKRDLVDDARAGAVDAAVRALNPAARVEASVRGEGAFDVDGFLLRADCFGAAARAAAGAALATPGAFQRWNRSPVDWPARDIFQLLCLAQIELVYHDS